MGIRSIDTHALVDAMKVKLFEHEDDRLVKLNNDLIKQNNVLRLSRRMSSRPGFIHLGVAYREHPCAVFETDLPAVEEDLEPEVDFLISSTKLIDTERKQIGQLLYQVINPTQTDQEFRDAIPDCLLFMFKSLTDVPRLREPGWTILDKPRPFNSWERLLPRIEFYCATRLIY